MTADSRRSKNAKKIGLVLPGGGARGAYQVGVLKALAELMPERTANPFSVISGTSAGAINSVVLACRARCFRAAVADMELVWSHFRSEQVYKSDPWTMLKTSVHWLTAFISGGMLIRPPGFLLDNEPLRDLLRQNVRLDSIQKSVDGGYLDAVAVTAAGYDSARSVSFFQGHDELLPWDRVRRKGRPAAINLDHLMASVAVPMVFPPVRIGHEFFGDGAMRQATPLSPAVRLGAERILVIGVRNEVPDPLSAKPVEPSLGRIAGYMLDALFLDGLSADLERLTRLNTIIENTPDKIIENEGEKLRFIEAFVMLPSEDIREIAARHVQELPWPVRLLLRGMGALNKGGTQLLSYLLFESGFTRELINLGYKDAMAHKDELLVFMEGIEVDTSAGISGWTDLEEEYTAKMRVLPDFEEVAATAEDSSEPNNSEQK